jgi:hypothetical protein
VVVVNATGFSLKKYYSRKSLWTLFLMAAFFPHVWTIILVFRDFSWITERNNTWDALGNGAYGLMYALVESLFVFAAALLLGLLISPKWDEKRRVTLLSVLILLTALGSIVGQLYFLFEWQEPGFLIRALIATGRPLVFLYLLSLAVITPLIALPVYLILKVDRFRGVMNEVIDRLSLLTSLYLVLDVIGLALVLIRNLSSP